MTTTIHLTADNFNGSPDFFNHRDPLPERLRDMTQERWNLLSNAQREAMRLKEQSITDAPTKEIAQMAACYWSSMQRDQRAVIINAGRI